MFFHLGTVFFFFGFAEVGPVAGFKTLAGNVAFGAGFFFLSLFDGFGACFLFGFCLCFGFRFGLFRSGAFFLLNVVDHAAQLSDLVVQAGQFVIDGTQFFNIFGSFAAGLQFSLFCFLGAQHRHQFFFFHVLSS